MSIGIINDAIAATPGAAISESFGSIAILVGFVVIFYFLLWRPQSKRAQEHRKLVGSLAKGDRVMTSGGLMGTITELTDDQTLSLEIAPTVCVKIQKGSVSKMLPNERADEK